MNDFLDEKRREITDRLAELKPLVDEFNRLQTAASALAGVGGAGKKTRTAAASRRRGPGRPKGSVSRSAAKASKANKNDTQKTGSPAGQSQAKATQSARRTSQRQRHARCRSARPGERTAGHRDPRARQKDGHQAELSLPRAAEPSSRRKGGQARARLAPQRLASSKPKLRQRGRGGRRALVDVVRLLR